MTLPEPPFRPAGNPARPVIRRVLSAGYAAILAAAVGCASDATPTPAGPRLSAADFGSPDAAPPRLVEPQTVPPLARIRDEQVVSLGDPLPTTPTSAPDAAPTDQTSPPANPNANPGVRAAPTGSPTRPGITPPRGLPPRPTPTDLARTPTPDTVQVRIGEPSFAAVSDEPVQTVLADAMVGDINGRPVYASVFFADLDARFRADAARLPRDEFLAQAEQEIRRQLTEEIERELLRAEAIANLPQATREYGVSAFLGNLRGRISDAALRQQGGSQAQLEQYLRDSRGQTLEDYLQEQTEQELIIFQFKNRIESRVNVTWREIRAEYERRFGEFNPRPVAVFRWIRVRSGDADAINTIQSALDAGRPFPEVAAMPANAYSPELGGLFSRSFADPIDEASFFNLEEVNARAVTLQPGEWAGPIESGRFTSWVMLERIERRSSPLYDVQAVIAAERKSDLTSEELGRYVRRLRERASFTDIDEMTGRLLRIAAERYLPPTGPAG
ncbi:MAG: hypothetical protein ACF8SC_04410 [Phycisphaerales bacterium JB037]